MACYLHLGLEWKREVSLHGRRQVVDHLLGYPVLGYYEHP